jgi:hypothetical protein
MSVLLLAENIKARPLYGHAAGPAAAIGCGFPETIHCSGSDFSTSVSHNAVLRLSTPALSSNILSRYLCTALSRSRITPAGPDHRVYGRQGETNNGTEKNEKTPGRGQIRDINAGKREKRYPSATGYGEKHWRPAMDTPFLAPSLSEGTAIVNSVACLIKNVTKKRPCPTKKNRR